jgi:hypothetical protein
VRRPPIAARAAITAFGALALNACSTTIDPAATTAPPGPTAPPTTFAAEGTTAELLTQLVGEATGLSEAIVQNEGDEELIARIDALWTAARPAVAAADPDLVDEFDRAIEMMDFAVSRRRHADADKALNNLRNLIAALPPPA